MSVGVKDGRDSAFSCNLSEDEAELALQLQLQKSIKIPHEFDQKAVTLIKCKSCLTIQPPGKLCTNNAC